MTDGPLAPEAFRGVRDEERLRVPWGTVVPLAVAVAYGDGFWMIAMRGAVGSIERVDAPFRTWLWESSLLLPAYVLAVVAALTLSLRRFGPDLGSVRGATAATLVAVVAATTLAGVAVLAASSAYDYRLQIAELAAQHAGGHGCGVDCLTVREQATLALQLRAVGLAGVLMLVCNALLVCLVVAFRGGRLDVAARGARRGAAGYGPETDVRRHVRSGSLAAGAVAGLLGTAVVHAAVVPQHWHEWPAAGAFLVLLCGAEAGAALWLLLRTSPAALRAVVVLSAATVMVWLDSRLDGLTFGPRAGVAEPVGVADAAATLLEVATLVAALTALRVTRSSRGRGPRPQRPDHGSRLAVVGLVAVACVGLGGALGVFGQPGHGLLLSPGPAAEHPSGHPPG